MLNRCQNAQLILIGLLLAIAGWFLNEEEKEVEMLTVYCGNIERGVWIDYDGAYRRICNVK